MQRRISIIKDPLAWTTITEQEYSKIKHIVGNTLPNMAISAVQYVENIKPTRAKWRIVALSTLDPHELITEYCFAPVISMVELYFMVSLAIYHKCTLWSCDVKESL